MTDSDGIAAVETIEQVPPAAVANGEPLLRAEGIWKVFGPGADKIIGSANAALSRSELQTVLIHA